MPVSRMEPSSGGEMPALLNATSTLPYVSNARSYIRATSGSLVTSALTNRPPTSVAALAPASSSMSAQTTRAPSAASRRAVARPMPLPAPVMTATRSSSRCMSLLRGDEDVLGLGERGQRVRPQLTAEPGLLEPAERGPVADRGVGVHRERAGLDRAGHPQRPADVAGPDGAGQAVAGVVGDADRVGLTGQPHHR